MAIIGFDHLVLHVSDAEKSLEFYIDGLGLVPVRVEAWRDGSAPFPSVRVTDQTIIDLVEGDPSRLDHICLVVEPADGEALLSNRRLTFSEQIPAPRYGAQGVGMSLYTSDPDGNIIELRWYTN